VDRDGTCDRSEPEEGPSDAERLVARSQVARDIAEHIVATLDGWATEGLPGSGDEDRVGTATLVVYLLGDARDALLGRAKDPDAGSLDRLDDLIRRHEERVVDERRRRGHPTT
jgi:hypothetical protein